MPSFSQTSAARAPPSRSDLDKDSLPRNAGLFVETDEIPCLLNGRLDIEREPGIDFGRDATGDNFKNLPSESDQQVIDNLLVKRCAAQRGTRLSAIAFSRRGLYSGSWTALKIKVGFVVASCGAYCGSIRNPRYRQQPW